MVYQCITCKKVCDLRQPKTRSQDGTSTEICQLHRGKLELQHSLAAQVLERIYAINKNNDIEGWHHSLNRRAAG